jgi:pimeloyl-ACP methyl ester carboxylesterase
MSTHTFLRTEFLIHSKVTLALHLLRQGSGRALLVLHGLGEDSSRIPLSDIEWSGPVWALDFTGHGASSVPVGGGYSSEILLADVDFALTHIGSATILGYGLGAYVALLTAGARPDLVHGAVLADGPGLSGGAVHVSAHAEITSAGPREGQNTTPDPWALIELSRDARPESYVTTFIRLATASSPLPEPIALCCRVRPPWVVATQDAPGVIVNVTVNEALAIFANE